MVAFNFTLKFMGFILLTSILRLRSLFYMRPIHFPGHLKLFPQLLRTTEHACLGLKVPNKKESKYPF